VAPIDLGCHGAMHFSTSSTTFFSPYHNVIFHLTLV
jgi:hypothetical protein